MAGAGHGDFSRLVADETKVVVEGVGSVIVHPKDTLDATMNGVGAILYTGNPREVNTRMNGLGTIARRDAKDDDDETQDASARTRRSIRKSCSRNTKSRSRKRPATRPK